MKGLCVGVFCFFLVTLCGCEQVESWMNEPARQLEKAQKENKKLQTQVAQLNQKLLEAEADSVIYKVLVSLYDMRHALEKFARNNKGRYPHANNINELQAAVKSFLPETFEIEAIYIEKAKSQENGYIMIANVKGREIVVSNLL